ncbi:glycosyltransferase family A protein [Micromonospora sp. NPDC005652]|uniref:glycosyltransferase family 2 protein n=1 Tax=Micromonospora sp. NPDC005652 TaxID=3157046 RepID=UPI0034106532
MSTPELTVIIPAHCTDRRHGSSRLRLALLSLCHQTLPADRYEIIVVDNGSDPPVTDLLARWGLADRVRLLTRARNGICGAFNAGIAVARAPLILLGTDDEIFGPGALEAHVRHHAESGQPQVGFGVCYMAYHTEAFHDVTTAEVVPHVRARMAGRAESAWLAGAMTALGLDRRAVTPADVTSGFDKLLRLSGKVAVFTDIERTVGSGRCHRLTAGWLAMRLGNHTVPTEALRAIGGFDEQLDEYGGWLSDVELGLRLVVHGLAFGLVSAAPSINLPHPRGDGYLMGEVPAMAYMVDKHRRVDVALAPLYFQRGYGIASFSRLLATAVGTTGEFAPAAPARPDERTA